MIWRDYNKFSSYSLLLVIRYWITFIRHKPGSEQ